MIGTSEAIRSLNKTTNRLHFKAFSLLLALISGFLLFAQDDPNPPNVFTYGGMAKMDFMVTESKSIEFLEMNLSSATLVYIL